MYFVNYQTMALFNSKSLISFLRITKDPHIRNRPRKGTAKIGAMCPAHMFYTECDDGY